MNIARRRLVPVVVPDYQFFLICRMILQSSNVDRYCSSSRVPWQSPSMSGNQAINQPTCNNHSCSLNCDSCAALVLKPVPTRGGFPKSCSLAYYWNKKVLFPKPIPRRPSPAALHKRPRIVLTSRASMCSPRRRWRRSLEWP